MALDTLANVKLAVGVTGSTDDGLLAQLQDASASFITEYCGRSFTGGTFVEYHPGGARFLVLANFPVVGVTSVHVDAGRQFGAATARDPAGYVVHADRGVVECVGGPFLAVPAGRAGVDVFPGAVQVTYATTTGAVPGAVLRADADLIGHWYRQVKTHASLGHIDQTSAFENGILTEFPRGLSEGFALPPGVLELLAPFRERSL